MPQPSIPPRSRGRPILPVEVRRRLLAEFAAQAADFGPKRAARTFKVSLSTVRQLQARDPAFDTAVSAAKTIDLSGVPESITVQELADRISRYLAAVARGLNTYQARIEARLTANRLRRLREGTDGVPWDLLTLPDVLAELDVPRPFTALEALVKESRPKKRRRSAWEMRSLSPEELAEWDKTHQEAYLHALKACNGVIEKALKAAALAKDQPVSRLTHRLLTYWRRDPAFLAQEDALATGKERRAGLPDEVKNARLLRFLDVLDRPDVAGKTSRAAERFLAEDQDPGEFTLLSDARNPTHPEYREWFAQAVGAIVAKWGGSGRSRPQSHHGDHTEQVRHWFLYYRTQMPTDSEAGRRLGYRDSSIGSMVREWQLDPEFAGAYDRIREAWAKKLTEQALPDAVLHERLAAAQITGEPAAFLQAVNRGVPYREALRQARGGREYSSVVTWWGQRVAGFRELYAEIQQGRLAGGVVVEGVNSPAELEEEE